MLRNSFKAIIILERISSNNVNISYLYSFLCKAGQEWDILGHHQLCMLYMIVSHCYLDIFNPDLHFLLLNSDVKRIVEPSSLLCALSLLSGLIWFFLIHFLPPCTARCTVCSCAFCVSGQQVKRLLSGLKIIKWHRRKWK